MLHPGEEVMDVGETNFDSVDQLTAQRPRLLLLLIKEDLLEAAM